MATVPTPHAVGCSSSYTVANPPPAALLSDVSVAHGQPWSENIKQKVPEVNNSYVLTCRPFWAARWTHPPTRPARTRSTCVRVPSGVHSVARDSEGDQSHGASITAHVPLGSDRLLSTCPRAGPWLHCIHTVSQGVRRTTERSGWRTPAGGSNKRNRHHLHPAARPALCALGAAPLHRCSSSDETRTPSAFSLGVSSLGERRSPSLCRLPLLTIQTGSLPLPGVPTGRNPCPCLSGSSPSANWTG